MIRVIVIFECDCPYGIEGKMCSHVMEALSKLEYLERQQKNEVVSVEEQAILVGGFPIFEEVSVKTS